MKFLALGLAFALATPAQTLSLGVSAGVPISPHSQNYGQGCISATQGPCGSNDFYARPYAVGPVAGIGIRWGVSIQAGALYERFHIDQTRGLTVGRGSGSVDFGHQYSVGANAWLFPLLLRYTRGRGRISPFVNAGATLRHLGVFTGNGTQLDFYLQPHPATFQISTGRDLDAAVTAGTGLKWRAAIFDIAPEVRFLHWTSSYYQPAQNQAMLIVAITFPLQR
ncbi:MAG: hypothetical protein P4L56_17625 [Candidatus Sulfopaludibacter sp.]|nr:hypothetical protein [Candidatus Sulfopaludibacter sp.]